MSEANENICVAVVGATGAVGREMINVLEQRAFPISELRPLASERSAGTMIEFRGDEVLVQELRTDSFEGVDIALFSAGGGVSKEFAPIAAQAGAIVVDNSSAFRMDDEVPLVVPEVNADVLREKIQTLMPGVGLIVANPNCVAIPLTVVLNPLQQEAGVKRVVVSTYQSVSGAGKVGMDELWNQTLAIFNQQDLPQEKFPHQIAFNCIPHIDDFAEDGRTFEEIKIIQEAEKVLELPDLKISVTSVRVPTFSCHAISLNVELEQAYSADAVRELLSSSPGVIVDDEPTEANYPTGIAVGGSDATYVGRIREDSSVEHGLNMWIVADNLRKGAALNAVEVAELVVGVRAE